MTDTPSQDEIPAAPARALSALPVRLLLPIALFGTYPLALIFGVATPWSPGRVFLVSLPTFGMLALASIPYLLGCGYTGTGAWGRRLARWVPFGLLTFLVVFGLSAAMGGSVRMDEMTTVLGLFCLPLFFAIAPRHFLPRRLSRMLALLWGVNVVHSFLQIWVKGQVVALAGNRNWAASLLACLLPWLWVEARRLSRPLFWTVFCSSTVVTAWLVWLCHCRALWLALAVYAVLYVVFVRLRGSARLLSCLGIVLVLGLGAVLANERIGRVLSEDIRQPLYEGTLELAAQHPVLGVGPGNFRREYAEQRSAEHQSRRVTASVTEHPHDELLRIAAELGFPAALAWTALLGFALLGLRAGFGPVRQACHFSATILLIHGMLDKVLALAPTNVLAMLFVGLLLRWRLPVRLVAPDGRHRLVLRVLAGVAIAAGAYLTVAMVWHGTYFRRATQAEDLASDALGEAIAARRSMAGAPTADADLAATYADKMVAEAKQQFQRAYEAYVAATHAAPWDARTHTLAGFCACVHLGNPEQALQHYERARALEPDFSHLNAFTGEALMKLNRGEEAIPFFAREADRFQYDVTAWLQLFRCVLSSRPEAMDLLVIQRRICELRLRKASDRLAAQGGDEALRQLVAAFALAAEGDAPGQTEEALVLARQMTAGLALRGVEATPVATADPSVFTQDDIAFWHTRMKWRNAWVDLPRSDAADLLRAWQGLPDEQRGAGFAEFAESAGWRAITITTVPETVEIRRELSSALAVPAGGRLLAGANVTQLLQDEKTRQRLGVKLPDSTPRVLVRVGRQRLFGRTQCLAFFLHRLLPDTMPDLYRSPLAMLHSTHQRMLREGLRANVGLDIVER